MATFYTYELAFNPAKTVLALSESGLLGPPKGGFPPISIQSVNLLGGESLQPWFMKVSPGSTVPALALPADKKSGDSARVLTETIDILRYADAGPNGPIGGLDIDRALVEELTTTLNHWDGNLWAYYTAAPAAKSVLTEFDAYREKVAESERKKAEKGP
ncbi:hypothetical protein FOA52_009581 [Chlamydomonas sp. UWO 241]|nr:hypothetical protein FOA52_009581 [Chlamydomonas sp. UWO 241]